MNKQKQPSLPVLDHNCSYYPEHLQETPKGFKLNLNCFEGCYDYNCPNSSLKKLFYKEKVTTYCTTLSYFNNVLSTGMKNKVIWQLNRGADDSKRGLVTDDSHRQF